VDYYLQTKSGRRGPYPSSKLRRLVAAGKLPERARLQRLAGPTVRVLGYRDDATVRDHLQRCRAFLYAAEEDFGIVPVEAMAAGAPVVAFGRGGVTETVVEGETGRLVDAQDPVAFAGAVAELARDGEPAAAVCRARAEHFGAPRFRRAIDTVVATAYAAFHDRGPLAVDAALQGVELA